MINRLLSNRLVLQLLFTSLSAISLAALSVLLIANAIRNAEGVVLGEANKTIASAISEVGHQYQDRVSSDSSWSRLPEQARDISLQGITQIVLRSYPGVEGGFYSRGQFLGYAFPTHDTGSSKTDVPAAERSLIIALVNDSMKQHTLIERVVRGKSDLLVLGAAPATDGSSTVWVMKRFAGRGTTGQGHNELLLAILVLAALVSIAGTLATGLSLARGVSQIKSGLARLERDFDYRLPHGSGELGVISHSINQMAEARGKLEVELRRQDRLRAIGRLAAGFAHEIRNPLNSIRLTVQLLERRLETNSVRREDLQTVRTEVDRLSALLNDLLDLQRSRLPQPVTQSLAPVLEHCVSLVERQAEMQNVSIGLEISGDAAAFFDSQQLTQTVVNLLLNALEASSDGGRILVRTSIANGIAQVEVADDGPGLGPEQQEHVFEPFYTTKVSGSGLGLAVSRELMRSQGGDLFYAGVPKGARFVVQLPRSENGHAHHIDS